MSGEAVTAFGAACVSGPDGAIEFLLEECEVDLTRPHIGSLQNGETNFLAASPLILCILYAGDVNAVRLLASKMTVDLRAPLEDAGGCTPVGLRGRRLNRYPKEPG